MRAAALVFVAVAAAVALAHSGSGSAGSPALTWKVDPSPFRITVYQGTRVLLQEHTGPEGAGTRLSYRINEGGAIRTLTDLLSTSITSTGAAYTVATSESDRTATVSVSRTPTGLRVGLDLGKASTTVRTVYESFDAVAGEHYLGTGEHRDYVDLRGQIIPIKTWHECGMSKPAPFFLSSRGYGVRYVTNNVGRMAFGTVTEGPSCQLGTAPCEIASKLAVVQACFKTASLAYEVYSGTPEQIVTSYATRTGRPTMPTPDQFALMKWRDVIKNESELTEDADQFAAAGIPLGWVIVDNPWELGGCMGSMLWDPGLFPNPVLSVDRMHARGIKVMMWVSSMVQTVCGRNFYPRNRVHGDGKYQSIDLTDPAVQATFEGRLRNLLASGVDGFKVDRGDEVDLELRSVAAGSGNDFHNPYTTIVAKSVDKASRAARGKPIPTLFRSGFTGSQSIVTGTWSGDLPGNWNGLENAIRSAQTAGLVGYSTWGSDVGGYDSANLTAPVLVRWAQLGAISPVFEIGGVGKNAKPWELGAGAMAGIRKAAILHYELFPYLYQLARRASATGISVLRPLALQYPNDEKAWSNSYELLVGPDLLAAPLRIPGTAAPVYLPAGQWLDLGTGQTLTGPRSLIRPTPLDQLPLYLRSGAAIPYNLRTPDVWRSPWLLDDLFRKNRGGWLVAPDAAGIAAGDSADYGSIRATMAAGGLRVVVTRAPRETQVDVLGGRTPKQVTIDGKVFKPSATPAALRAASQGWLRKRGALGGVVLKLAPTGGRSVVVLTF